MSQSILQNGYAILLSNTSDLDRHLLAQDQLLKKLSEIKATKETQKSKAIAQRQSEINKIDTYIEKLINEGGSDASIDKYLNPKAQLEAQIVRIGMQNVNATFDDVRATHSFFLNKTFKPLVSVAYGYSSVGITPLPIVWVFDKNQDSYLWRFHH